MAPRDLYGLPLERFTEERNLLAKELRREGHRDEAARVVKLRKPTVAAWAVNQLVRSARREIDALFEAGDASRQAQTDLLAKRGDAGSLRHALEAERAAVDQLTENARGLLSSEGHELTPARLEHVSETLHAAALDEDARTQVRQGCLDRELRHIGLGVSGGTPASSSAGTSPRGRKAARTRASDEKLNGDRARDEERTARVKSARKAEADALRRADRTAREVTAAEQRRERAGEVLRDAEEHLATARARAETAAQELQEAQRTARDLRA